MTFHVFLLGSPQWQSTVGSFSLLKYLEGIFLFYWTIS
jgi:hypothetical protein